MPLPHGRSAPASAHAAHTTFMYAPRWNLRDLVVLSLSLCRAGGDKTVKLWNWKANRCVATLQIGCRLLCCDFGPGGRHLVAAGDDKLLHIYDVSQQKELTCLSGHADGIFCVKFSGDGQHIASGSQDKSLRVWDLTHDANADDTKDNTRTTSSRMDQADHSVVVHEGHARKLQTATQQLASATQQLAKQTFKSSQTKAQNEQTGRMQAEREGMQVKVVEAEAKAAEAEAKAAEADAKATEAEAKAAEAERKAAEAEENTADAKAMVAEAEAKAAAAEAKAADADTNSAESEAKAADAEAKAAEAEVALQKTSETVEALKHKITELEQQLSRQWSKETDNADLSLNTDLYQDMQAQQHKFAQILLQQQPNIDNGHADTVDVSSGQLCRLCGGEIATAGELTQVRIQLESLLSDAAASVRTLQVAPD